MALTFVQHSAATATTGAIVSADTMDWGTATAVQVQTIKFGYGTEGVYNEVGTGLPLPAMLQTLPTTATLAVLVQNTATVTLSGLPSTATIPVTITNTGLPSTATIAVIPTSLPTTATLPVTITNTGLPTTATIAVTITGGSAAGQQYAESVTATASATGFIGNIMLGEDSDDTLRIIRTTASGEAIVSLLSLPTTATLAVVPTSLPTTATLAVTITNSGLPSTATIPVAVGIWTATGQVLNAPLASATGPVSITTWAATAIVNMQQMTTSTSPVSVTSLTATGVLFINTAGTATLLVSMSTAATHAVSVQNTATVAISGRVAVIGQWANDATATVNQPVLVGGWAETTLPAGVADGDIVSANFDVHGRQIVMPFSPRDNIIQYYTNASATADVTLATGAAANTFRDLVGLVVFNAATTLANVSIESSSTATTLYLAVAGDGGGLSLQPMVPWKQAIAATNWVIGLATAVVGKVHFSAQFMDTT